MFLKFSLALILFAGVPVFANEAKEEPKKEGGGPGSGLPPWFETEAKLAELSAKIKAKEETVKKLIADKDKLPEGSAQAKPMINELVKEHAELKKLVKDYEKNINILKYRFPERGAKADRKYQKHEVKSIEELDQMVGIDGRLSRNVKRMRSQFGSEPAVKNQPEATTTTQAPQEKSIEEAEPIILRK